jgi:hypothetical protein
MPATITVTCTWCGTSNNVHAEAMLASVEADSLDLHFAGSLSWVCCGCLNVVTEPIGWRPFLTLLTVGLPLLVDDAAQGTVSDGSDASSRGGGLSTTSAGGGRRTHPEHPAGGPASAADDQLEIHELLSEDAWLGQLVAGTTTGPRP